MHPSPSLDEDEQAQAKMRGRKQKKVEEITSQSSKVPSLINTFAGVSQPVNAFRREPSMLLHSGHLGGWTAGPPGQNLSMEGSLDEHDLKGEPTFLAEHTRNSAIVAHAVASMPVYTNNASGQKFRTSNGRGLQPVHEGTHGGKFQRPSQQGVGAEMISIEGLPHVLPMIGAHDVYAAGMSAPMHPGTFPGGTSTGVSAGTVPGISAFDVMNSGGNPDMRPGLPQYSAMDAGAAPFINARFSRSGTCKCKFIEALPCPRTKSKQSRHEQESFSSRDR